MTKNVTATSYAITAKTGGNWASATPSGAAGNTITGTGFGIKTGTPYYDDFESESLGAVGATIGGLKVSTGTGTTITNAVALSGTKSVMQDFAITDFPKIYRELSGTNTRAYMAGYFKFTGAGGTVWKLGRIGAGSPYSGDPKAGASYTSAGGSVTPTAFSGEMKTKSPAEFTGYSANNTGADKSNPPSRFPTDTWLFYEVELYTGTEGVGDSWFSETVSNKQTVLWENLAFLDATAPDLPDWFLTVLNGHDGTNTLKMYMDTIYFDESRARVVMTDNATYASSTKWAVQPNTAWSDTSITITPKRQSFSIGATAYNHVFNQDGTLVHTTAAFTVGADA